MFSFPAITSKKWCARVQKIRFKEFHIQSARCRHLNPLILKTGKRERIAFLSVRSIFWFPLISIELLGFLRDSQRSSWRLLIILSNSWRFSIILLDPYWSSKIVGDSWWPSEIKILGDKLVDSRRLIWRSFDILLEMKKNQ